MSDELWTELSARCDVPQLLELLAIAGFYHLVAYIANGAAVAIEPSCGLPASLPGIIANMTKRVTRTLIAEWTVTVILLLFGTTTLLQAFVIPSGSMEDSLLVGDHVLVDKLAFAPAGALTRHLLPYTDVRRGDVIVFRYPLDIRQNFVKRAIGLPGDHLRLVNKQLILNGKPVPEPYALHIPGSVDPYRDNFPAAARLEQLRPRAASMVRDFVVDGDLVVPPGFIFAMGDNRENSDDCRYWGLVPRENVIGTPVMIYWSFDAPTEDLNNGNISIDHVLDVAAHFFTKTRWSRTFKLVRSSPLNGRL